MSIEDQAGVVGELLTVVRGHDDQGPLVQSAIAQQLHQLAQITIEGEDSAVVQRLRDLPIHGPVLLQEASDAGDQPLAFHQLRGRIDQPAPQLSELLGDRGRSLGGQHLLEKLRVQIRRVHFEAVPEEKEAGAAVPTNPGVHRPHVDFVDLVHGGVVRGKASTESDVWIQRASPGKGRRRKAFRLQDLRQRGELLAQRVECPASQDIGDQVLERLGHPVRGRIQRGEEAHVGRGGPGRGDDVVLEQDAIARERIDVRAGSSALIAVAVQVIGSQRVRGDQDDIADLRIGRGIPPLAGGDAARNPDHGHDEANAEASG